MKRLTISSTPLGVHCTHWTTLDVDDDPYGPAAKLGDMNHEKIECALNGKPIPKFSGSDVPGAREVSPRFWNWHRWATKIGLLEKVKDSVQLIEQQIAYDSLTGKGRLLPKAPGKENEKRDYSLALPHEIPGTLDYARLVKDPILGDEYDLVVFDWKTYDWNGKKSWKRTFRHASTDMQVRSAVAILSTIFPVRQMFASVTYIPPPDADGLGEPFGEIVEIKKEELPEIFMDLDRCAHVDKHPKPGPHCAELWCSAGPKKSKTCPAATVKL